MQHSVAIPGDIGQSSKYLGRTNGLAYFVSTVSDEETTFSNFAISFFFQQESKITLQFFCQTWKMGEMSGATTISKTTPSLTPKMQHSVYCVSIVSLC